jgi:diguanylate cyclase (GGDEF)-like protein
MWVYRDVTDRHVEAVTDPLTGLYNRRGMEVFSDHFIRLARREDKVVLVVAVDIDGLKPINDRLGHEAGDAMIKGAAKVLQDVFRRSDVCARIGGDEFVVLAVSSGGFKIQDRVRQAVSRFNLRSRPPAPLSLSVGVRAWEPPALLADVIREADAALYRVKKAEGH